MLAIENIFIAQDCYVFMKQYTVLTERDMIWMGSHAFYSAHLFSLPCSSHWILLCRSVVVNLFSDLRQLSESASSQLFVFYCRNTTEQF